MKFFLYIVSASEISLDRLLSTFDVSSILESIPTSTTSGANTGMNNPFEDLQPNRKQHKRKRRGDKRGKNPNVGDGRICKNPPKNRPNFAQGNH